MVRNVIAVGAAMAAAVLLVIERSTTHFPWEYDGWSWFRVPAAGALGLGAVALHAGSRLWRGHAVYMRWLGAGLTIIGLALIAVIVGFLAFVAAIVYAWGTGP